MRYGCEIDSGGLLEAKRSGQGNFDFLKAKGLSETLAFHVSAAWRSEIEELEWLREDSLYSDSWDFLSRIQADLVLCSARSNEVNLRSQLGWLQLDSYLCGIACVPPDDDVIASKAKAWQSAGTQLVIGDSEIDALAASALGLPFFLLHRGFRGRRYLAGHGRQSHAELPDISSGLKNLVGLNGA